MSEAARKLSQEYWRPANPATARAVQPILAESMCSKCGVQYAVGAHFCHECGRERDPRPGAVRGPRLADAIDTEIIRERLGLSVICLVLFVAGITCLVIAAAMGLIDKTEAQLNPEVLQFWRIEWLLGGIAALLAGVLLKKKTI